MPLHEGILTQPGEYD